MSYIAIVGEDWERILGLDDRGKYIGRKVGIILHQSNADRLKTVFENMQIMSANADLSMPVLLSIIDEITDQVRESAKYNSDFLIAVDRLKIGRDSISDAAAKMTAIRRGD